MILYQACRNETEEANYADRKRFETVVNEYEKNQSIRDTAISLDISRVKVRKILITVGVFISPLTDQVR